MLELGAMVINGEKAVEKIVAKLDSIFLKDGNIATYQAWQAFNKFKRPSNMNMADYTIEYNRLYTICKNSNLILPTGVLAIQYLESANLTPEQHRLALATCATMDYDHMKTQVLKISTEIASTTTPKILQESEIKVESTTFHTEYYNDSNFGECDDEEDEGSQDDNDTNDTLFARKFTSNSANRQNFRGYNRENYRARRNNQRGRGFYGIRWTYK